MLWTYTTPGIPDNLFEQLPGIYLTPREIRILILCALRLEENSVFWDIGAGTGTIPVEAGLLCPNGKIIAIERDEEVANLIRRNCSSFQVKNITVIEGNAPECLEDLKPLPDRICIEGGKSIKEILTKVWGKLKPQGRVVLTSGNLEYLYQISEGLSQVQARQIEIVQASVNRLENKGTSQVLSAIDPLFIISAEKI
ncbi:MAG: precorrin-6Y C5,15-methyltransferase subunit CbiT [Cyanobacteriota bacterium ELA615]|jgi:cobalt-precorrin-6B (C15)-methyltransferase